MTFSRSLGFLVPALLAGCSITHSTLMVPTADGRTAAFAFDKNGAVPAENADIKIEKAVFDVDSKAKGGKYIFAFREKRGGIPVRVKVEDVTEAPIATWVADSHPQLIKGVWQWTCPPIDLEDKTLGWLHTIDPSIRVYRFTIVNQDGNTLMLDDASTYSSDVKEFVRKMIEAPPAAAPAPAPVDN